MISHSPLLLFVLLSAPLVARAWVSPSVPKSVVRMNAFQIRPNKQFQPRNNNRDYEPYDWKNDRLEQVDTENERPWKIDELSDNKDVYEPFVATQPSRRGLSKWKNPSFSKQKQGEMHIYSRAQLSTTDAGTLVIDLPATGVDSSTISSGVFGAIWFSSIVPVTLAGGLVTGLFMLPFWLAGSVVAKNALVDPFVSCQITIGQYAWSLTRTYASKTVQHVEGSTRDLQGARVQQSHVKVNDETFYEIQLCGKKKTTSFGHGLNPNELEYLAQVMNEHLQGFKRNEEKNDDGIFGFLSGGREGI